MFVVELHPVATPTLQRNYFYLWENHRQRISCEITDLFSEHQQTPRTSLKNVWKNEWSAYHSYYELWLKILSQMSMSNFGVCNKIIQLKKIYHRMRFKMGLCWCRSRKKMRELYQKAHWARQTVTADRFSRLTPKFHKINHPWHGHMFTAYWKLCFRRAGSSHHGAK